MVFFERQNFINGDEDVHLKIMAVKNIQRYGEIIQNEGNKEYAKLHFINSSNVGGHQYGSDVVVGAGDMSGNKIEKKKIPALIIPLHF